MVAIDDNAEVMDVIFIVVEAVGEVCRGCLRIDTGGHRGRRCCVKVDIVNVDDAAGEC